MIKTQMSTYLHDYLIMTHSFSAKPAPLTGADDVRTNLTRDELIYSSSSVIVVVRECEHVTS